MPAHEPIEFVPGDFEYNARVAALLGPCWAIMLMFGGKTTTGALACPSPLLRSALSAMPVLPVGGSVLCRLPPDLTTCPPRARCAPQGSW